MSIKKYIFPSIIALSALAVSASAAFYSVSGLSKLFAGASTEVIIMTGSLEVAKLIVASLLYQFWDSLGKTLRTYLTGATVVLMLITSMGIYGFLSSAYQETYKTYTIVENRVEFLEEKSKIFKEDVDRYTEELTRSSQNISTLSNAKATQIQTRDKDGNYITSVSTTELRMAQQRIAAEEENRKRLAEQRSEASDSLQRYQLEILELQNTSEISAELGPLQYISTLLDVPMNKVVNFLLIIIIFVFDPLAIAMVLAANFAFKRIKEVHREEIKVEVPRIEPVATKVEEPEVKVEPVVEKKVEPKPEPKPVEKKVEPDKEPLHKRVKRILQVGPSKNRVQFDDGTEGRVPKRGDELKKRYW